MAALQFVHVQSLVKALGATFYIDADMIEDAIRRRSEFNLIHLATMFKVDVFVVGPDARSDQQLDRGMIVLVDPEHNLSLRVASPEDTVAHKLADSQWRDAVGVLKVQGAKLDLTYLESAAASLGVADLLARARTEAGTSA